MDNPYPSGNGNGNGGGRDYEEWRYRDVKGDIDELKVWSRNELSSINSKLDALKEGGKLKPGIIIACAFGVFGMITTLVSAGWYLTTLQTQNLATPLTLKAEVLGTALAAVDRRLSGIENDGRDIDKALQLNSGDDERSKADRFDMARRLDQLSSQVGKLSGDVIANASAITEVETQFKADELVATQRESNTEQWKGMFYNWQTGLTLPARGPVVPGIARDPSRSGG